MAFKQYALDGHTSVTIYKRKTSRSLRLSIAPTGQVRVSIPTWTPYSVGLTFARSRLAWIASQRKETDVLVDGQAVGKAHHLRFVIDNDKIKPASRVRATEILISYPEILSADSPAVQDLAQTASFRALRGQAEQLLPQRLALLAERHGFTYRSISIKRLKSRWGSCDQQKNIVLNLFLMQLPWECIDYVLLHELVHTEVLRHGPDFWMALAKVLPHVEQLRKQMRNYQPVLHGSLAQPVT